VNLKYFSLAVITAALVIGLASCSSDEPSTPTSTVAPSTTAAPAVVSAFGDNSSDMGFEIRKRNATAVVETVEERGGTPAQAIAALLASQAETDWRSGLSMASPATGIRDIYGWRFAYNIGAVSTDAVRAATYTFMKNTEAVDVDPNDPVAYALAVQQADARKYVEEEHFYKNGETAASEYAEALPIAEAAYSELRGTE
jgi:hypothetical protein